MVPTPSIPSNGIYTGEAFAAAVWVGIDGDTYNNAILQTGIDLTVNADGSTSFSAWYEWFPDYSYNFDLEVNAGDEISMSVVATTSTSGTALVENLTTGQYSKIALTSAYALGGQNAEWIVEDFQQSGAQVQLVNFGTVVFTDAVATTSEGLTIGPTGSTILDMRQSGTILTSSSSEGSTVTVKHI